MSRFMRFVSLSLVSALALFAFAVDTRLAESVRTRDLASARSLLAQHVDVNAVQPDGMTALIWAAHNGDVPAAELLLKAGANVKIANRYGVAAVTEAATMGNSALVEMLLKAGADANTELPLEGDTALMLAARTGDVPTVKALLDHGARVEAKEDRHGETALMAAAGENHPDVVRLLIEHGADVNAQGRELKYPLIVKQDVMSLPPVGGLTPLMEAARENSFRKPPGCCSNPKQIQACAPPTR